MNLRLVVLHLYVPPSVRRSALEEVLRITADAFGCGVPPLSPMSHQERLRQYAAFTRNRAIEVTSAGRDPSALAGRLWRNAHGLGSMLRHRLRIRTTQEALAAARVIYRILDIDFHGTGRGDVVIGRCSFSAIYPPEVCRIMSALDAGLLAGLTGGGRLAFSARITEGHARCLATLAWDGALS